MNIKVCVKRKVYIPNAVPIYGTKNSLLVIQKPCEVDVTFEEEIDMKIKVKFFDKELYSGENFLQKVGGSKSDWIDLRASEETIVEEGQYALIPLGVAMQLPEGYEAQVVPRSSTFKHWGIIQTNSMGVIDESYCGDNDQWHMPVVCLEPKSVISCFYGNVILNKKVSVIKKGDRICQFRIVKHQPPIEFEVVESLGNPDRNGIGSTGK